MQRQIENLFHLPINFCSFTYILGQTLNCRSINHNCISHTAPNLHNHNCRKRPVWIPQPLRLIFYAKRLYHLGKRSPWRIHHNPDNSYRNYIGYVGHKHCQADWKLQSSICLLIIYVQGQSYCHWYKPGKVLINAVVNHSSVHVIELSTQNYQTRV